MKNMQLYINAKYACNAVMQIMQNIHARKYAIRWGSETHPLLFCFLIFAIFWYFPSTVMWYFPSTVVKFPIYCYAMWEILWWERGFVWWREGAWFFELLIWLTQSTPGYVVPLACNVLCEPCSVCDQEGNSITPEKQN